MTFYSFYDFFNVNVNNRSRISLVCHLFDMNASVKFLCYSLVILVIEYFLFFSFCLLPAVMWLNESNLTREFFVYFVYKIDRYYSNVIIE